MTLRNWKLRQLERVTRAQRMSELLLHRSKPKTKSRQKLALALLIREQAEDLLQEIEHTAPQPRVWLKEPPRTSAQYFLMNNTLV